MNYHEFVRIIEKELNHSLEGGKKASLYTAIKNNSQKRIGIIIERPDVNIAPTIYLEDYFRKYQDGEAISEIILDILRVYDNVKCEKSWDPELVTSYEKLQSKIVFRIINTKQNEALLEKVPHVDFMDLSMVFYALFEASKDGSATMLIYYDNLEQWGISKFQLVMTAIQNSRMLLPPQLITMNEVIAGIVGSEYGQKENLLERKRGEAQDTMYVLSNPIKSFGAACIAYPGMLKALGELFDADYYILPSSIHEVILVPDRCGLTFSQMTEMVVDVNRTQVAPEEILSDHAYFYDRKNEKLSMTES